MAVHAIGQRRANRGWSAARPDRDRRQNQIGSEARPFRQPASAVGGRGSGAKLGRGTANGKTHGDRYVASPTGFAAKRGGRVERNQKCWRREYTGGLGGAESFAFERGGARDFRAAANLRFFEVFSESFLFHSSGFCGSRGRARRGPAAADPSAFT